MAATPVRPRLRLWPSLPPGVYARRPLATLPFPLSDSRTTLLAGARHGLWHGVRALGLGAGDEVLAPAYHCGQEVEALVQTGVVCRFYEATESLAPDAGELDALVGERTRALFLIHYYGFPQDLPRWRRWCDERGLLLLEDCAHAFLAAIDGAPVGSFGDLAVFSFAKTVPLPDGGALVGPPVPAPRDRGRLRLTAVGKRHARWLMARLPAADRVLEPFERSQIESFELGNPDEAPAPTSAFLLRRLADPGVAAARRANYARLLEEFRELVPPAFSQLPPGASPLIFPIDVSERPDVLGRLERAGVVAEPFWPELHPLLPVDRFPRAVAWHGRFVALPVHQELSAADVERIAAALRG